MSEDGFAQPPTCPECGAKWIRSGHRFIIEGKLSHMSVTEAADRYYQDRGNYDDTIVAKFECGTVVPTSELP